MDKNKIIQNLSLEKKAEYSRGVGNWHLFSDEKLGVKKVKMSDGPHGLRTERDKQKKSFFGKTYQSICYPSASLSASSFDRDLIYELGEVLASECKEYGVHILLGPAINIKRNPLCGRNFEYVSEDPYVVGEFATAIINGIQKHGIGTSIKHFAVNSQETERLCVNAVVDERALRDIYLRGFKKAIINSKPYTIMAAYNRVNGHYACSNQHLLKEILRDEWGYEGMVESDWCAVNDINDSIRAGLDLEMPESGKVNYKKALEGLKNDPTLVKEYDRAILNQLNLIDKCLDLNPTFKFDYEAHHAFAKKVADESIVLLKNENNILPLSKDEKILFVGGLAEDPRYQGGGSSNIVPFKVTKMSELIKDNPNVTITKGYEINEEKPVEELLSEALKLAKTSDKVVCFLGFNAKQESEGYDKKDMKLYHSQIDLIEKMYEVNKNIIVVLENGSVIELPFIDKVSGLVEAFLGGEAINESIYDVLYGNVNPSGKLNETFIHKYEDTPSYNNFPGTRDNVLYKESIFVGYRYFDTFNKDVLFPFGYGLSYSTFEMTDIKVSQEDTIKVNLNIKNTSSVKGKEVVQVYVKKPAKPGLFMPSKELVGFSKVALEPNETKNITIEILKEDLTYFDIYENRDVLLNGEYILYVGNSSKDNRLVSKFDITGEKECTSDYSAAKGYFKDDVNNISDEDFNQLFISKKAPLVESKDGLYDINVSFGYAADHGSVGAKKLLNKVSKFPFIRSNEWLFNMFRTTIIRQLYMGSNGKLKDKHVKAMIELCNDINIKKNIRRTILGFIRTVL